MSLKHHQSLPGPRSLPELFRFFGIILGPEKSFYVLAVIYGIGISLLSLATPVSVQMLVNSIVNTGLTTQLVVLSLTLFGLLLTAGVLYALRIHLIDVFGRKFYARMVSEITIRCIYALNPFFEDSGKGPLFNRYFDIIIVMKRIPYLLIGGFSILLMSLVGFILVSMYHPAFMLFSLFVIFEVWVVWHIWGDRAIKSAMTLSHKKHAAAAWIEGVAGSNGFFKTRRHINSAIRGSDRVTAEYMQSHVDHFRQYFSQSIAFLFIYAFSSAALLGLGGWLVIRGELTIGQLVAAELVFSVIFAGVVQLGTYLSYFYDLCAAVDELSLFYDIEQEEFVGEDGHLEGNAALTFNKARGLIRSKDVILDFSIPSGARVLAYAESHGIQRLFKNIMRRHYTPDTGYVTIGGHDIEAVEAHIIRHEIIVLNRPNSVEMSVREYLTLSGDNINSEDILKAIRMVGLEQAITHLDHGLDTRVASSGWPLSIVEIMQLKLAAALLAKPKVLIMSHICDTLPTSVLENSMDYIQQKTQSTTIIRFSNHHQVASYDSFLFMGEKEQTLFQQFDDFCAHKQKFSRNPVDFIEPSYTT